MAGRMAVLERPNEGPVPVVVEFRLLPLYLPPDTNDSNFPWEQADVVEPWA